MTKKSVKLEVNNFIQGLITEASPLNFPANASFDEENFILNRDGTRDRRYGMDIEKTGIFIETGASPDDIDDNPPTPFKWLSVNGDSSLNFLVLQIRDTLTFHNLNSPVISSTPPLGQISLSTIGFSALNKYSFTAVDGLLVAVSGARLVGIIEYNGITFNLTGHPILVRDQWGVEVDSDPQYETDNLYRGSLHPNHAYNLYNQSWGIPRLAILGGGAPQLADPIAVYNTDLSKYPSNSEAVWAGMKYQPVAAGADPFERFYPKLLEETFGESVSAAKGSFIIELLNRGYSRTNAVAANYIKHPQMSLSTFTPPSDITPNGATVLCDFAGRVWYGGFGGTVVDGDERSPNLASYVAFSQLVGSAKDIVRCYQEGDPTSREKNELLETDGGFIRLSGVERIISMVNIGASLIIIASNGVWSITGGGQYGFAATNYKTERLSTFGGMSRESVVSDGSRVLYWADDGIYVVARNQLGDFSVDNLILKSIQKFYSKLSSSTKRKSVGVFEAINKKIRWLYHTKGRFTSFSETRELILDLSTGAWSSFLINKPVSNTSEIVTMFTHTPFEFVTASGFPSDRENKLLDTRYVAFVEIAGVLWYTFSYYNNDRFRDWESLDSIGIDAKAYLTTGAITADDSSIEKQVPYLTMHFRRTERGVDEITMEPLNKSGCIARSQWDWANSANSNKWGSPFQAYRERHAYLPQNGLSPYNTGFELVTSKSKLRGRGKAFALHLETEPYKDCRIAGWNISVNGNIY